jgi:hypothetical protein
VGVWQGDVSLSFKSELEGIGRQSIFDIPAKPGKPVLLHSSVWLAVVRETIIMGEGPAWAGLSALLGLGLVFGWVLKDGCRRKYALDYRRWLCWCWYWCSNECR